MEREPGERELYREGVRLLFEELVTWRLAVGVRILAAAWGREHSGEGGEVLTRAAARAFVSLLS